jgi:hypothetical protein
MKRVLLIVALAAILANCSSGKTATDISRCPGTLVFAVAVDVRDAQTGRPAGTGGVLYGTHTIGITTYIDSGRTVTPDGLTIYTGSLAGTYDLRLRVPGYAAWIQNGVVVHPENADGSCGTPTQVHLQATLQPAS